MRVGLVVAAGLLAVATALVLRILYPGCPPLNDLAGKVVLITGASSGIGEELAYQYAQKGAKLVLAARRRDLLEQVGARCKERGAASVTTVVADMGSVDDATRLVQRATTEAGDIDVLLLNHAQVDHTLIAEYNATRDLVAKAEGVLRTNVLGSIAVAQEALPSLLRTAGRLVVVSSGTARVPAPFHATYGASKRALHGYFDTLRLELGYLGWRNVTVSVQVLGMIGTPENIREPGLRSFAMPLGECVEQMICATQAREDEPYIPRFQTFAYEVGHFFPRLLDGAMYDVYIGKVPEYLERLRAVASRVFA